MSTPLAPTRRTLAKGAAWSVPVLAMTAAAPAMAVSGCPTLTTTDWTYGQTGSWRANTGTLGWATNGWTPYTGTNCGGDCDTQVSGITGPALVAEQDAWNINSTLYATSTAFTLAAGQSLTISFYYTAYGCNANSMKFDFQVIGPAAVGTSTLFTYTAVKETTSLGATLKTVTYTATQAGSYQLRMLFTQTTDNSYCNYFSNDMAVSLPTFTTCA